MTLREKLKTSVSINTEGEAGRFANQCEKIADDYAIEFAEWMSENYSTYYHELSIWNKDHKKYSNKELLEIFKKEKGWI